MRIAAGGAAGAALLAGGGEALALQRRVEPPAAKLKLCQLSNLTPTDDDLLFMRQLGFAHVFCATPKLMSVEEMLAVRKRYGDVGITVHNIRYFTGGPAGYNTMADILLNRPGRAQAVEDAKTWLRNSGKAGFHYTGSSFSITGVWQGKRTETRFSDTREFNFDDPTVHGSFPREGAPAGMNSLYFGREYSREEVLDNYSKYFVKEVLPVAEDAGVHIGFHPDDPPVYDKLGGVARVFGTMPKIRHVFERSNDSPYVGLMMCCGTWNEGGANMGATTMEAVRYFWTHKKFWEVHFRNTSGSLPRFHETYMDNGAFDMYEIMRTLVEIGYDEQVNLDHTPAMVGAPRTYPAYAMGYMKAMLQRAEADVAKGRR